MVKRFITVSLIAITICSMTGCASSKASSSAVSSAVSENTSTSAAATSAATAVSEAPEIAMSAESSTASESEATSESASTEESAVAKSVEKRENTDFRNACWGDDIDTVKQYESAEFYGEESDFLAYYDTVSGHKVLLSYLFDADGKLVNAGYQLDENLTTGGQYLDVFNSWHDSLVKKYGDPNGDKDENFGKTYYVSEDQANSVDEGTALEYGYTAYKNVWITDKTKIILGATSKDYKISVVLFYEDKNYKDTSDDENF